MLSFWILIISLLMIALGLQPNFWAIPLFVCIAVTMLMGRYIARREGRED